MLNSKEDKKSIIIFSCSRAEYYILEPLVLVLLQKSNLSITFLIHHNYTNANTENLMNKNVNIIRLPSLLSEDNPKYASKFMHSYVISNIVKQVSDFMLKDALTFDLIG